MSDTSIPITRVQQPGNVECGPAAICAAVSIFPEYSVNFSIQNVIDAAGVAATIAANGTNVTDLANAVSVLSDDKLQLLYKINGSLDDILGINAKGIPVILDWQGSTFTGSDGIRGHYSIVEKIDTEKGSLTLVDSLPDFPDKRIIYIEELEEKWWDTDSILVDGKNTDIRSEKLLFIIVPNNAALSMVKEYQLFPGVEYIEHFG